MTIKENVLRTIDHNSPDHVPYFHEGGIQLVSFRGARPPANGRDMWGVQWQKTEEDLLSYPVEHPVDDIEELLSYSFPDAHAAGLFDTVGAEADLINRLVVGCHFTALFERLQALCGMDRALIWMLEEQEKLASFLLRLAAWNIEIARSYVGLGVEAGRISDDYGSQTALLMSPDLWRSVVKPALTQIVEFYKNHHCLVMIHSCGNIMAIMPDLVEIEIDVFNIQTAANDLPLIKQKFGSRITIQGGVDTQRVMTRGTPDQVREATLKAMRDLGEGGGLILEPDQHISMPRENLEAFIRTVRQHGSYSKELRICCDRINCGPLQRG
jgi:uroporphyrinogen decarboxylase